MKILLVLVLFVLISVSSVFAVSDLACNIKTTNCDADEITTLKFADSGHASIPSDTNTYPNRVCCKSANNRVTSVEKLTDSLITTNGYIRLSGDTNAHLELFNATIPRYNTLLKFVSTAPVDCASKASCTDEETCLFSISGDTNAAVGNCGKYPARKICCSSGSLVTPLVCTSDTQCEATQKCNDGNCEIVPCRVTNAKWKKSDNTDIPSNQKFEAGTILRITTEARGDCESKKVNLRLLLVNKNNEKIALKNFNMFPKLRTLLGLVSGDNETTIASKINNFMLEDTLILDTTRKTFVSDGGYQLKGIRAPKNTNPNTNPDLELLEDTKLKFDAFVIGCTLTANPTSVTTGGTSELTLNTIGYVSSAHIDNEPVTIVNSIATRTVTVTGTKEFFAKVNNADESNSCSTTVTVNP